MPGDTLSLKVSNDGVVEGGAKQNRTRKAERAPQGGKRAVSGYMKFCKAVRPQLLKENPGISFKDVGKRMGEKWRALSESEKSKY